ncbi:hypothetical protein CBR_g616 [Chara braunii]|uniref:Uncharacterized protein n=1 Tax=Chara braunii TaxID=69332 RepID=A0A388KBS8_CHABU|nr:hypothetical protein CBR_g616 [Chara braunii]|eukprot:GBG67481.1 hypothetical protein CBR_g616 [Chara braunii]
MILHDQCPLLEELRFMSSFEIEGMPRKWFAAGALCGLRVLEVQEFYFEEGEEILRGAVTEYRSSMADALVIAIAKGCPQLSVLLLNGLHTGITDKAVRGIEQFLPRLERLGICGSSITDGGLALIGKKLESLRELRVQYCTLMTARGVLELAAEREDLVVIGQVGPVGYLPNRMCDDDDWCGVCWWAD